MKKKFSASWPFLGLISLLTFAPVRAQQPEKLPDTPPADLMPATPDYSLMRPWANAKVDRTGRQRVKAKMELPDHVHNGLTKYFPPRFNQSGGSCGSAAEVTYQFGHEINAYRDLDASKGCNLYPTHFTWLMSYHGSEKISMMRTVGVPDSETYGGFPYSRWFGAQDWEDNDYGVMQGYDRWFRAMHNRIVSRIESPISVESEEGRQIIKRWLYNHNGDESFQVGGVCGIGVAAGPFSAPIAATKKNKEIGLAGMQYVTSWNEKYNHAMTVVGYDDRVEFDLDKNGVYGEVDKDEVGAWIVCNSWGAGWGDDGFMYCPYKYGGALLPIQGDYWTMGMNCIRKDYRPLVTMKITLDYSKRSEICLGAGVSADTTATKPESTILFDHFKYAGLVNGKGEDPEIPMLGRWVDGLHYEPLEFGYDLTDLTANYDRTQPLKYFFFINSKKTATGEGLLRSLSLMNYEYDRNGIEMPFDIKDVKIENKGKTTMVTLVARGEQLYKPLTPAINNGLFTWNAPQASSLALTGYCVYADGEVQDTIPATQTSYALPQGSEASYTVAAVYKSPSGLPALSMPTSEVRPTVAAEEYEPGKDNQVAKFDIGGFTVPHIFESQTQEATFEFWLKPANYKSYNQAFGPGWGTFYFHTTNAGAIYYGWDTTTGNRSAQDTKLLTINRWTHIAVTVKGSVMTLYVNGVKKSSFTASTYSGLAPMGQINFGSTSESKAINGQMDELRIWRTCRTRNEILKNKDMEIANPSAHPDLIAYYKMDTMTDDLGNTLLRDCVGGHHATLISSAKTSFITDNSIMKDIPELAASIQAPSRIIAQQPCRLTAQALVSAMEYKWNIPSVGIADVVAPQLDVVFPAAGEYEVTMTATDVAGNTAEATKTLTVVEAPAPTIDFALSAASVPAGDRVGLVNKSNGTGIIYKWLMPGAMVPEVSAANASAVYETPGTYTVTLVATLPDGTERRVNRTLDVVGTSPIANFNISTDVVLKGEKIYLADNSRYAPTTWKWHLDDGTKQYIINGQNSSFTPTRAGAYSVTLDVANEQGTDRLARARAFLVAAADSKNGLSFAGVGQKLTIAGPMETSMRNFTIDFWLRPNKAATAFCLSADGGKFQLQSNEDGSLTLTLGGKTCTTPKDYILPSEWHHYAIALSTGKPSFYRDAELIYTVEKYISATSLNMTNDIVIGNDEQGMMSHIDELRIWNNTLTNAVIKKYCNQPITDIAAAEADGLCLYYDFNQNGGNPTDLTSGAHNGVRTGFGPDGDAWGSSKGVFTLGIGEDESDNPVDITAQYLNNYKRPFYHRDKTINKNSTIYKELEWGTKRSSWKVENPTENEDGTIIAGVHVNSSKDYDLCVETGWSDFPTRVSDHLCYQTFELPEGAYRFTTVVDPARTSQFGSTRIMVAEGEAIPTLKDADKCIACVEMTDDVQQADFILSEPTMTSMGLNINLNGTGGIYISAFRLEKIAIEILEANGEKGEDAILPLYGSSHGKTTGYDVRLVPGGLVAIPVVEGKPQPVAIYNMQGHLVARHSITAPTFIPLTPGIYVANGLKVAVKK